MSNPARACKKPGKGWPAARRARQALRIRQSKPWVRSTGPKTAQGKAASAINARTHGMRSAASLAEFRRVRRYLRLCRERTDLVAAYLRGRVAIADVKSSFAVSYMREFASPGLGAQRSATVPK